MPRILAIDWDRKEVRGVLISSGPTGTSVSGAWAATLTTSDPAGLSGKQIGTRLAAAMGGAVSGKVTTLVGVGRDNVQMKLLTLPPAPVDELPELVRFQAEREFTALGNDAALDFIPLAGDAQTPNQVLALALNPAGMAEARDVCQALGVEPDRIPVRGCAAAALVNRAGLIDPKQVALIVNPLTDEADLAAQAGDTVVLMRTVRLPDPSQPEARQRTLLGEIRRTMAAVRQQSGDRQVGQVIICGTVSSTDDSGTLAKELEVPVAMLDPVTQAPAGLATKGVDRESLGRFAAVLGMALGEADRQPPIVDFANVRRKVEARRFGRVHAVATAFGVLVAFWFVGYLWQQISAPARELAALKTSIRDAQSQADKYKLVTAQAAAIERWQATDVVWLDEIEQFARHVRPQPLAAKDFPVADDSVITQLTLLRPPGANPSGGRMDVQAVGKSPTAVASLEQRLRDKAHSVATGGGKLDKSLPGYEWSFGLEMHVPPAADEPAEGAQAMNKRERMLAGGVLLLVLLFAGKSIFGRYQTALSASRAQVADAKTRLAEANKTLAAGRAAVKKVDAWQQRSLPSDRDKALSLYKSWLLAKAKTAGLAVSDIKLAPRTTASTAFDAIGYQIEATGSLSSVVSMLYEFYTSPQLQQVTKLKLARQPGASQIQVTLEVEALCLQGAIAVDSLPEGDAKRLKLAKVGDYQKSLNDRDIATAYTPPRPPGPPPTVRHDPPPLPKFDESELAYFSGTVNSGTGIQAWILVRSTGETMHLMVGDTVKVGAIDGQIESIEARSLVYKAGEKKYRVALGQPLRKGKELDANGDAKPESPSEGPKS